MTNLGEMLRLYSRVNAVGVRELAEQLRTPKSTVSRLINGKSVEQENVLKIINWLFTERDDGETNV